MLDPERLAWSFCYHDPRHATYDETRESHEEWSDDPLPAPMRDGCACESCFNGRSFLADEIDRLRALCDASGVDWRQDDST